MNRLSHILNLPEGFLRIFGIILVACFLQVQHRAEDSAYKFSFRDPSTFKIDGRKFNLAQGEGLAQFREDAEAILARESDAGAATRLSKKDRRGLREMLRRIATLSSETDHPGRARLEKEILETAAAIANNHRPVIPRYVGLPDLPFRFVDSLSNPVGKGRTVASNLEQDDVTAESFLSQSQASSFWRRPEEIAAADLYAGFGREERPRFDSQLWTYSGPKKAGGNPGCELVHGERRIKVKFAEVHSEPFASRIFHAMGYHVEPTDYVPRLRMQYDRRFFLEFNQRPELKMKIGLFFIPIHTFHFERTYDPFEFIDHAVFRDGTIHSGGELKAMLLREPDRKTPLLAPENFNYTVETAIEYLVTTEANVQVEDDRLHSIGPWDFGGLGHEDLRELRGAGVLAGWVGWWDSRFDNTRLRIVETGAGRELRHYFSDLGAGLGRSAGTYSHSSETPEEFSDTFTRRSRRGNQWRIEFPGYEPIEDTPAFKQITLDDARWMARLIGQLRADQIEAALRASGFDDAEVRVYTEKLIARRNQLLRDADLSDEFEPIRVPSE